MPPELDNAIVNGYAQGNGFYDPVLNAFFLHFARDGRADGSMRVYRYKKAQP